MSDRFRNTAGLLLIMAGIVSCLISVFTINNNKEIIFSTGQRQIRGIQPISTERNGKVTINQADAEELTSLPGIGETLASLIVAERHFNGIFYYAEDLGAVKGIGLKTIEKFRGMIDLVMDESGE